MRLTEWLTSLWSKKKEVSNLLAELPEEKKGEDLQERQGTVGSYTTSGRLGFLISNERNPKLASIQQRVKIYGDISRNVHIVATGLRYFSSLISGIKWGCKPPPDSDEKGIEYAKLCELIMNNMDIPFYKVVRNGSQFKWIGFSIQECIARRMDFIKSGLIGIGRVENRPQGTIEEWYVDEESGDVTGWKQRDPNNNSEFDLDRDRCIYIVDDTLTSSPDGVGLLRHVVELCDQLRKLEQIEGWAFETDLRGIPVAWAPTALLDDLVRKGKIKREDADSMLSGVKDFIENHMRNPDLGLLLDSSVYASQDAAKTPSSAKMWNLELAKGQGTGLHEIHEAIQRKCNEIARVLGIESFMLGANGKGSLALSEDKSRNLLELINSTIKEISWSLKQDYLKKIFIWNKWDMKYLPDLMPDAAALRSITVIVDALSKMALAGAIIDRNDPIINQVRGMLGLVDQPEVTPEMIAKTQPPNDGGNPKDPSSKSPKKPTTKNPDTPKKLRELLEKIITEDEEDDVETSLKEVA